MRRSPGWGAVEERKLDSARPAMVSVRGALPVVLAQRRGGRERFIFTSSVDTGSAEGVAPPAIRCLTVSSAING